MSAANQTIFDRGHGPRRNHRRPWRRRWLALPAVALLGAGAGLALAFGGLRSRSGHVTSGGEGPAKLASLVSGGGAGGEPVSGEAESGAGSNARSPLGLPLGTPALALRGLSDPRDAVHVTFRSPPRAGLLFNLQTGRVLWKLHPLRRVPIASLTKMMTALMVVQSTPRAARVMVTKEARQTQGSKVGLLPLGRELPVETMMYGLLLPSGNDAAVALAEHVAGSVRHFVREMNMEAALLGLGCTEFSSPSGLIDSDNFSCPADLAVLAHDDLAQPRIARVVSSPLAVLPFPIKGGKLFLYNNNPILIYGYPGADGLKTGYTTAAGKCLVATAERRGVKLGVVLLDASQPGTQAQRLLDEGFERVYHVPPVREPPIPGGV